MRLLLFAIPIVLGLLIVKFLLTVKRRQAVAVFLAWLFPGLGHFYLGLRGRGLFLGGVVIATFVAGLVLADFRNISPFDRHPLWAIAHVFGGLMSGVTAALTLDLKLERDVVTYAIGCLYSAVATLLNILLMIDVYDRGALVSTENANEPSATAAEGPMP